jgi:hypothetical protein
MPGKSPDCERMGPFDGLERRTKRNPEKWGDNSGLNVTIEGPYNKRQAPEHNA